MKRTLALILSLALLICPALPALAADDSAVAATKTAETPEAAKAEPVLSPTPEGVKAEAAQALSPTAEPSPAPAPELPAAKEDLSPTAEVLESVSATAEPNLPKDALVAPVKAKPEEPESPYKWKNFGLGFLGGAFLGGAVGVLFFSQNDRGGLDAEKAKVMAPIGAGIGGLAFGLAAFFLGTTTPEEIKPPKVEVEEGLKIALPAQALAGLNVRYTWSF